MVRIKRLNEEFGMDQEEDLEPREVNYRKEIELTPTSRKAMLDAIIKELQNAPDEIVNEISILLSTKKGIETNDESIEILANKIREVGPEVWNSWTDSTKFRFLIFNGGIATQRNDAKHFLRSLSQIDYEELIANIYQLTDLKKSLN